MIIIRNLTLDVK